jgi:hypothetical protein
VQIKAADDQTAAIAALTALRARPDLPAASARLIDQEIKNITAGARGEREAAYDLEFFAGSSKNVMTIHDLRLEFEGQVAQIDHLIITRLLVVWVCESKHFAEGVTINEQGEWLASYRGRSRGLGSPVEQNRRHVALLNDMFAKDAVELPTRLGFKLVPQVRSLVLISKNARIARPLNWRRLPGLDTVIKSDQLVTTIDQAAASAIERGIKGDDILPLLRAVGSETIERLARSLVALHKPIAVDWTARFAVADAPSPRRQVAPVPRTSPTEQAAGTCAECGTGVSPKVAAFSELNRDRFGGRLLCYKCQRKSGPGTRHQRPS